MNHREQRDHALAVMFNPFAAPISRIEPRAIAAAPNPARPQFKLLGGGAKVRDDEIDGLGDALEVRVLWQDTLLSVHRVPRGESFFAGDPDLSNKPVQLALSRDVLGAACVPIVVNGCMVISDDGSAHISDGEGRVSLEDARLRGEAVSRADGAGTYTLAVPMGRKVSLSFAGVVIEVQRVRNARRLRGAWLGFLTSAALIYVVGSVVAHAGVLASLAYFTPPLGTTPSDSFTDEQRYLIMRYLDDGATPEEEAREREILKEEERPSNVGGGGLRAKNSESAMGNSASHQSGRWAAAGDAKEVQLGRDAMLREASTFGAIGLLNGGGLSDPNAPTVPWGGLVTEGMDAVSANGSMWADEIGAGRGSGGFGLLGIGEGGGGFGEGLGLGPIGTYDHGSGNGIGQNFGNGRNLGRIGRGHQVRAPSVRIGQTTASGRLPPEVIQRAVRNYHGRFRACYESGLRNNPSLQGAVTVSFVIGRDGAVSQAGGGGSMPDAGVTSCVSRAFYGLSFPSGDGIVTVAYTITFTPAA